MTDDIETLVERAAPRAKVGAYLAQHLANDDWRDCEIMLVAGGNSNLTFIVSALAGEVVLRRPPLASRLPTAHDMVREYRVMTALRETAVPVPTTRALSTDETVLGAPFYVMERVPGHIVRDHLPPGYAISEHDRTAIGFGLTDVLADLHAVDPAAVGLGDHGRPRIPR